MKNRFKDLGIPKFDWCCSNCGSKRWDNETHHCEECGFSYYDKSLGISIDKTWSERLDKKINVDKAILSKHKETYRTLYQREHKGEIVKTYEE